MSQKRDLFTEFCNLIGVIIPYRYAFLLAEIALLIVICELLVFGIFGVSKNYKNFNSYVPVILSYLFLPALYTLHELSQPEVDRIESEIISRRISYERSRLKPGYCEGCYYFNYDSLTDEQGKQIICSRHPEELISQNCPDYEHHTEVYERIQREKEKIPVSCQGCLYYHGKRYGDRILVCALHPDVRSDDNCPDFEYK